MTNLPFISVVIPCRNEVNYIAKCFDSIMNSDYPLDHLEILLIDGMSDDGTRAIVNDYCAKYSFIKMFDNPNRIVPHAMNTGITNAIGKYIVRLDVHSVYPQNYVSTLINFHLAHKCANVGAAWETNPANDSAKARSIAISLSSTFGVGNSEYRTGIDEDREYFKTDAVPFGCYPKDIFDKVGLYDEQLVRNQDDELNERIIKNGGEMFLIPSIKIQYFARENFRKVYKMMFQYGYFGPLVSVKLKTKRRLRKYVPSAFVLALIVPVLLSLIHPLFLILSALTLILYLLVGIIFSIKDTLKSGNVMLAPLVLWGCLISHIGYGLGYLKGLIDFPLLKKHNKGVSVKLSR